MEVVSDVTGGAVPLGGPLGEHLLADPLQLAGDRVVDLPGRPLLRPDDLFRELRERLATERPAARSVKFVEHDPEAEYIGPPVDPVALLPPALSARGSCRRASRLGASSCRSPRP